MRVSSNYSNVLVNDYWVWCRIQGCGPCLQTCSTWSWTAADNPVQEFCATTPTLHLTSCFVSSDYYQCQPVSGLQIWQMCCSIACCTSLQEPGHAGGMLELQLKKNLLILQSSGSPKQSFPLFWSSLPQSAGKSSSLPEDRSDWIELGPNKKLLTGLKGQDPVPVSLLLPILCIFRHPNKGRGRKNHSAQWRR